MIVFLEFFWHVVSNLADSVKGCITNFWIWVLTVLTQNRNHHCDLLRIVNILTNLTKRHYSCMFIAPV